MRDNEERISRYIDDLNAEKIPKGHKKASGDDEFDKLAKTVRRLRRLREAEYPDEAYQAKLTASLKQKAGKEKTKTGFIMIRRALIFTSVTAMAAVILFASIHFAFLNKNPNVIDAMEKAMKVMRAYHGITEITETNASGVIMTQSKQEVWVDGDGDYYVKELAGLSQGLITVNNGQQKWQLRPDENKVYLFSALPDPYHVTFEIGNEVSDVKSAQAVETVGEEVIGGRETKELEVTPYEGEPYHLWIDKETDLPIQKQWAVQNGILCQATYDSIEYVDTIPQELMSYSLPGGYQEINNNDEQVVATMGEAEYITGFQPKIPDNIPGGFTLKKITADENQLQIGLYYFGTDNQNMVVVEQKKAPAEFTPGPTSILGTVNNNQAEILEADTTPSSIRWQESGMEYNVLGNASMEILTAFAEGLSEGKVIIPQTEMDIENKPYQIEVPYDLTVEKNSQESVDQGHSPWRLDPIFVTQVFASLLLEPEGIVGDYPIPYKDIKIIENNGSDAKAEISNDKSIAKYVYLKRLVRQDDTGIWTVVGYDPTK